MKAKKPQQLHAVHTSALFSAFMLLPLWSKSNYSLTDNYRRRVVIQTNNNKYLILGKAEIIVTRKKAKHFEASIMRCNFSTCRQFNRRKALQLNFKMFVIDLFVEVAIEVGKNKKYKGGQQFTAQKRSVEALLAKV